ncbi:UNVERIFIED_CONTAM: hypothetical protein PYX00_007462 [Menopon gallinae]|uniref:Uncharacterized protein n=1 Tax=Menopon gallinae TaxID=328185 RepID=A0AAW2HJ72_9NEOP
MEQPKLRKNYSDCRRSDSMPTAQKPCSKKKDRHKSNAYHANYPQLYDMGFTPYAFNLSPQARIHPSSQRLFPTSNSSVCHYPVPLGYSLEHVSLPYYPPIIPPGSTSTPPLERVLRVSRPSEHKIPAMFQTYKQNIDLEQDYMSLPPVNCDLNAKKPKDEDSTSKRRFSDPGVAQISSDECSGSRSSASSNNSSLQDLHIPYAYGLIEQVNELRQNNSHLTKELHEVKLELESLKMLSASWRPYSDSLQPGKLSDSIVEVREAIKVNEEALLTKMTNLFEKNAVECNEAHRQLEERIIGKLSERLSKLEEQVRRLSEDRGIARAPEEPLASDDVLTIQQQLMHSEREKLSLRRELQEAIDERKKAEANTQKLERLVGVLRKKVNGVSPEIGTSEEKQNTAKMSLFDQNPFIIANNKQSHKQPQQKKVQRKQDAENEDESGSSNSGLIETPLVTITGPVTDL